MKKCFCRIATMVGLLPLLSFATLVAWAASVRAAAPTFTNVTATLAPGLAGVFIGSIAWGDYDNDGRLDFLLTGSSDSGKIAQLWRNTGSGFANVTASITPGLPGVYYSSVAWGDYDNDGRLDFLLTGFTNLLDPITQVWRNTGNGFTEVTAAVAPGLPHVGFSSVAWGDYDNDGLLDFLLTGETDSDIVAQIWRNTGNGFVNVTATVAPDLWRARYSSVAWGDYDNDGRLDFLLTGSDGFAPIAQLWRNTGSCFVDVTADVAPGLRGIENGSVAWGDYDNDGRLDFLLRGAPGEESVLSELWRNTDSGFSNVTATVAPGLRESGSGSVAWGDYDNDGRLDFLLTGITNSPSGGSGLISELWRNTGTGFTNVTATVAPDLTGVYSGSMAWADYNNDGRLDFLLTGNGPNGFVCQLWRNNTPITNTPPSAPTGLAMTASSNAVMLSWNSATDDQTPASGLTYNVRASTTPGGNDLLSAHVNATDGFRRVPAMGNAMLRHSLPLTGLTNGQTVYWSVQAVDTTFAGGPFATETSVVSLPQLSVSLNSQLSTLNLSWAPPTFGWFLQQSPGLSVSNWTTTPGDSANPTTLPATNGAQFFRLHKP